MDPFIGVVELARQLRAGHVSALEWTAATLARIERLDPVLRSYITAAADRALADAEALDARRRRGEPLGMLHGVPVGIKDTLETAGIRTTYGSTLYAEHVPAEDQLCVARLRAAGAVVVGKTNTSEFAIGGFTWNELAGLCRNPHDPEKTPGGVARRLRGRGGGGALRRRGRERLGGLAPGAGELLRHRRVPHVARPRPAAPQARRLGHAEHQRADDPERARRGPDAGSHGGARLP